MSFDGRATIDGISLDLSERRIGLIGRNGSGKSTLLRLLAGLIAPDRGEVRLWGFNPARDRRRAVAALGVLFQNPDHQIIFPTVIEELVFGLRSIGMTARDAATRAMEVLAEAGHADWRDRPCHQLSQGERHLLCLLAVTAMEPRAILLDEPFTGVDRPTSRWLRNWLERLDPLTVLATHEMALLRGVERVIWIDRGRVLEDGPPATVIARYEAEMDRLAERPCLP
ncbi:energy-coupling factor ABC transporter ATP-binding protein [Enterovirga sp. CN4-39]|uniref:energy-coupling factor ABC transporter ATP-binding protein n=1 Tax=Enterovirga sp. CN4-39 TaxID=3400910 RepID=UPI003BFDE605